MQHKVKHFIARLIKRFVGEPFGRVYKNHRHRQKEQ